MSEAPRSTTLTRWGAPMVLIGIGIAFSVAVSLQGDRTGVHPTPGVLSGLPVIALVVLLLVRATSGASGRTSDLVVTLLTAFLIGLHVLFLAVGVGLADRFDVAVPLLTAILFLALAPTIAGLEPRSPMGLRVPATMAHEDVWRRVHRRLGVAFAVAGVLGALSALTQPQVAVFVTGGLPIIAMIVLALTASREQPAAPARPSDQSGD